MEHYILHSIKNFIYKFFSWYQKGGQGIILNYLMQLKNSFFETVIPTVDKYLPKILSFELRRLSLSSVYGLLGHILEVVLRSSASIFHYIMCALSGICGLFLEGIMRFIDRTWGLYQAPKYISNLRSCLSLARDNFYMLFFAIIGIRTMINGLSTLWNIASICIRLAILVIMFRILLRSF